ncbi:MAG TPA: ABC transporter ATP-binding protein [Bradyrhizobium sp.]|nr:ABC transporter ATP-binding protein [Bradyrhizobium sp.]
MAEAPILRVENLTKHFVLGGGWFFGKPRHVRAVDGVSFSIGRGETLGLVGESGCGKSTLARCVVRLLEPTSGHIYLEGEDIAHFPERRMRSLRRNLQIVFQDPFSSLNPRQRAGAIVGEPLVNFGLAEGAELKRKIAELFSRVGLHHDQIDNWPHEFSGGQRQRLGIARALAVNPALIVCDEPVSALDVSIQAQVINLLEQLQRELDLAYLFVSHDLAVVKHICHRIAVMYLGEIVETAPREVLFGSPLHPYTEMLLAAAPVPDPARKSRRMPIVGEIPSPSAPPAGCRFHTRCPIAIARCKSEPPRLQTVAQGHAVACHVRASPAARLPGIAEVSLR